MFEEKIKFCHQLGQNIDLIIVMVTKTRDCEHVMRVKKDLQNLKATDLSLLRKKNTAVSLCNYYRGLWNEFLKTLEQPELFICYCYGKVG